MANSASLYKWNHIRRRSSCDTPVKYHSPYIKLIASLIAFMVLSPAAAVSYESTILGRKVEDCHIRVEFDDKWNVMTVRSGRTDYGHCRIERDLLVDLVSDAFKKLSTEEHKNVKSVFLGRIVSYPWLSEYIKGMAEKSGEWDLKKGRPKKGYINAFVGDLIFKATVITDLNTVLKPYGLLVSGVSVEKVLVDTYDLTGTSGKGKLPFDAMMWLIIGT